MGQQPSALPLRLSIEVFFFPSPQVQGPLPPHSYHPKFLLSIHQPQLSVYWGMIFKISHKDQCSPGSANRDTSWLLCISAE